MTPLKRFISNHATLAYFALTFTISWGGVLLVIRGSETTAGTSPTSDPRFASALIAMLAGPSISGVLLTAVMHGRMGLREYLRRVLKWRVAAPWYAVAFLTAPFLWIVTLFALSLASQKFLPGIVTSDDKAALVLVGLAVALAAGIFEELGWTGFAIPSLRRHHGVMATGLLVGVPWGAWHLLTNVVWVSRATAGELSLSIFLTASVFGVLAGYLTAFRVLMVWVYDRTHSVLLAMLMHVSVTGSVLILDPAALSGASLLIYSFALAAAVWAAVAVVAARNGWLAHASARSGRLAA